MISYRKATEADIDFLTNSRMDFIRVKKDNAQYEQIKNNIKEYLQETLTNEVCEAVLAESDGEIIGIGIIYYYHSIPSKHNPTGKNAYITSMYVSEDSRRQGIAFEILDQLIGLAKEKEYSVVMLNASEMSETLYQKYGFSYSRSGMVLYL